MFDYDLGYLPRVLRRSELEPVRAITDDDLLTWEIQLKREGTLPVDVQRRLLEHLAERPVAVS